MYSTVQYRAKTSDDIFLKYQRRGGGGVVSFRNGLSIVILQSEKEEQESMSCMSR